MRQQKCEKKNEKADSLKIIPPKREKALFGMAILEFIISVFQANFCRAWLKDIVPHSFRITSNITSFFRPRSQRRTSRLWWSSKMGDGFIGRESSMVVSSLRRQKGILILNENWLFHLRDSSFIDPLHLTRRFHFTDWMLSEWTRQWRAWRTTKTRSSFRGNIAFTNGIIRSAMQKAFTQLSLNQFRDALCSSWKKKKLSVQKLMIL